MSLNENVRSRRSAVVLSPPGNPAAFPESLEFVDASVSLEDWRFKESELGSVHDMVRVYRDEIPAGIIQRVNPDLHSAMLIACTGMSYGGSPHEDAEYWRMLQDKSEVPVATATRAVEEHWREQGYAEMILVSPYDDRATAEAQVYWERAGMPVRQTVRVSGGHPYRVTADDLERAVSQARLKRGLPILLSGTGMRTKQLLPWIESLHDAPVWSVNQIGAAWIQKTTE